MFALRSFAGSERADDANGGEKRDTNREPIKHGVTKPVPLRLVPSGGEKASYAELADSLGYAPRDLIELRVRDALADLGIEIYSHNQVVFFMDQICRKLDAEWVWRPLSAGDGAGVDMRRNDRGNGWYTDNVKPYALAIPVEHLRNAKALRDKIGPDVRFFVTDYATKDDRPDPFIAAFIIGMKNPIVFGVWDEPGFGV